jgi:hypothetical protein
MNLRKMLLWFKYYNSYSVNTGLAKMKTHFHLLPDALKMRPVKHGNTNDD